MNMNISDRNVNRCSILPNQMQMPNIVRVHSMAGLAGQTLLLAPEHSYRAPTSLPALIHQGMVTKTAPRMVPGTDIRHQARFGQITQTASTLRISICGRK
uniref:Uncharacterized protein n=1 Tax=Cacopsylla melanoneura TaxID=428564 RepID=A0A8D8YQ51_9HEMI